MIVQFDLQYRRQLPLLRAVKRSRQSRPRGWPLVAGLTLLFVLWTAYRVVYSPSWVAELQPLAKETLRLVELSGMLTLLLLWTVLFWRHKRVSTRIEIALEREDLFELSPGEFEQYVAGLFRRKGYVVKMRAGSGDHGVDLELLRPGGKRAVVQCKRYRNQIGPDVARELYGTLMHERAAHAFLVTTADVSQATREWARGKPLTLIDGKTLTDVANALASEEFA